MSDGVGGSRWHVGDRVTVNRGDCDYWGHDSVWAPNGTRGTVDGSWTGHPGTDGRHHVAVTFRDGNLDVASLIFAEDELALVRRARKRAAPAAKWRPYETAAPPAPRPAEGRD